MHAHAGQVGDGDLPVALPRGAPPGREVSQLRIDLVARDGARRDRVPQVAVPLGLEHAVGDELVGTGEHGGLELDFLGASRADGRHVHAGDDPGGVDERRGARRRRHHDAVVAHGVLERRRHARFDERRELLRERVRALARAVPQGEPLERHFRDHGAGGEARQGAGADQQRRLRVLGREIPERERHRRGGAQVGQVAVLLEQDVGDTRLRVEQQEQSIPRRQPARAVLVEPGRDLEDDVTPALQVRSLHVHFGLLCGELHHHRIGERGFAQTEGPESPLDRAHGDGEGDLVPKRPERDDPHVSR